MRPSIVRAFSTKPHRRCLAQLVLIAVALGLCRTSSAAITTVGDVELVPNGSSTHIGHSSDGQMRIDDGSELSTGFVSVGKTIDNVATLDVVGVGTRLTTGGLQVAGFGRLRVLDGAFVSSGDLVSSSLGYGISSIEVAGELTSIVVTGHISLGQTNQASLYVHDGATIDAPNAWGYLDTFSRIRLDDGKITLREVELSGHLSGSGTVNLRFGRFKNDGVIEVESSLTIAASEIENRGMIDVGAGTLVLRGSHSWFHNRGGTIALRGGNLVLNTPTYSPFDNGGELIASIDVSHIYGDVTNSGSVETSRGELRIHGDLFNTGTVNNYGDLHIYGELSNRGVIDLESGVGVVEGNFNSSAMLATQLKEVDSVVEIGRLDVSGVAKFTGKNTLQMTAPSQHAFQLGDRFEILTAAGGITGNIQLGDMPELDDALAWKLSSNSHTLSLSVGLPGDFNGDNQVNLADYVVWRNSLGSYGNFLAADEAGASGMPDGFVDQQDYDLWKANFGRTTDASIASASSVVPEPGAFAILACGVLLALSTRTFTRYSK